jgi:carbonic anhydrase
MTQDTLVEDELLHRLRHFHSAYFPLHQQRFQDLVTEGQHPKTLFIACSDSRVVPYLFTGVGPGELFIVRNVGALIPPYDQSYGLHGTTAAIEFAVLDLKVERIIVCGHSHCGAIRAAYDGVPEEARALQAWLKLAQEALLPVQSSKDGEIHVFDVQLARFVPASIASNSGTGPYQAYLEHDGQELAPPYHVLP